MVTSYDDHGTIWKQRRNLIECLSYNALQAYDYGFPMPNPPKISQFDHKGSCNNKNS